MQIIAQGAEAVLKRDKDVLIKERIKKDYRINELDKKLRIRRTRSEAKLLSAAKRVGVCTPKVIDVNDYEISMEFIEGEKIKDMLNGDNYEEIAKKIASSVAILHDNDIVHGDLTTSNMILKKDNIWFIDFGLGFHSSRIEDKSVDVYLLKQIMTSTHYSVYEKFWPVFISTYERASRNGNKVIKTLLLIERRGRYRKR